jgi:membrane-associated phospholipid phosphatase
VTRLPAGFAHLFEPTNGLIVGGAGAGSLAVHPKDDDVATHFLASSDSVPAVFRAGHVVGYASVQSGLALGVYAAGRLAHREVISSFGADLVDAQVVNGIVTLGLKVGVGRIRPNGGHRSFPSGHTSATFATASVIHRHFGWKVALPVYALAGYVGASRVVDREHFVSDAVFGAGIGVISGRAVSVGHGPHAGVVTALPIRGGAALMFSSTW